MLCWPREGSWSPRRSRPSFANGLGPFVATLQVRAVSDLQSGRTIAHSAGAYHFVVIVVVELCTPSRPIEELRAMLGSSLQPVPANVAAIAVELGVVSEQLPGHRGMVVAYTEKSVAGFPLDLSIITRSIEPIFLSSAP